MVIKGCRTIAEYAIRRWMERENFAEGYFTVEMDGNKGTITDRSGDSLTLVYDRYTQEVYIKNQEE